MTRRGEGGEGGGEGGEGEKREKGKWKRALTLSPQSPIPSNPRLLSMPATQAIKKVEIF